MLGRAGSAGDNRPFLHRVLRSANLAGGIRQPRSAGARRRFDGSRIGRGASIGRVLSTRETSSRRGDADHRAINEACRLTGIGRSKLYELIQAGEIEIIKVGTITLVPMVSLAAFLDTRRT